MSIHLWKHNLSKKFDEKLRITPYMFYIERLYRARAVSKNFSLTRALEEFDTEKKLWNPSPKKATKQRCNQNGQSVLYLSSSLRNLPLELKLSPNQLFCSTKFCPKIKQKQTLGPLGVIGHETLVQQLPLRRLLSSYAENFTPDNIKIDNKIARIFAYKKNSKGFDIYNVTNAITQIFFHKNKYLSKKLDNLKGIIYPCVEWKFQVFNIVLKSSFAKRELKIKEVKIYRYLEANENGEVYLEELAKGSVFKSKIRWTICKSPEFKKYLHEI